MSFQILDVVLYGPKGEIRRLPLHPGKVNIITGVSKTGKTALIDIIEYCLGSEKCGVPVGIIRETVTWFALRLQLRAGQAFIARRAPEGGRASSSEVYYQLGTSLEIPGWETLKPTTNTEGLVSLLSRDAGIVENLHEPPSEQTRAPVAATIRHASFFLFLQQDEIGSRRHLFHRQGEPFIAQAIKDVLPYFLGAVGDDHLLRKEELRRWREKLRDAERRFAELDAVRGEGTTKATALLAEARDIGLTEAEAPKNWEEAIGRLRAVLSKPIEPEEEIAASGEALQELLLERNRLSDELSRVKEELDYARSAVAAAGGYSAEAGQQLARLKSIEILGTDGTADTHCPLCASPIHGEEPLGKAIHDAVGVVSQQLEGVTHQSPQLQRLVSHLERKALVLRRALTDNRETTESLQQTDERIGGLRDRAARRAHVIGRVSLYVEGVKKTEDVGELKKTIEELRKKVASLDATLSDDQVQDRVHSALSLLGVRMTEWGKKLELEHAESALRLDLRGPTVIVDRPSGPASMEQVGSWSNWAGYHLIALLSLHEWFVKRQRPVPHFLFLDQPAQGYFPADKDVAGSDQSLDALPDDDRAAALRIFDFIFKVVESLSPHFQVLLTEHADLKEAWFRDSVVARWRGEWLVPPGWKSNPEAGRAPAPESGGGNPPDPSKAIDPADPAGGVPGPGPEPASGSRSSVSNASTSPDAPPDSAPKDEKK
jgi:hypothetical protein